MMVTTQKTTGFSPNPFITCRDEAPIALSSPSASAWKAFQAGMQILRRYANRSPVDIHDIAKSNLQLLHRALSYDAQYSSSIADIRRTGAKSGQLTLRRLYAGQGLTADLLALQEGTSINLATLPQCYAMYLLISGSAQLEAEKGPGNPVRQWWERIRPNSNKGSLRNGAVVICSYTHTNARLMANGKNCLLLRVRAPTMEISGKTAS